ncbi:TPA: hypothetical protein ACHU77_000267, partial [Streptococcus suis]
IVTFNLPYSTKVTCFASLISNLEQPRGCSSCLHFSSLSKSSISKALKKSLAQAKKMLPNSPLLVDEQDYYSKLLTEVELESQLP